jgi:hypothetical protein
MLLDLQGVFRSVSSLQVIYLNKKTVKQLTNVHPAKEEYVIRCWANSIQASRDPQQIHRLFIADIGYFLHMDTDALVS